ncbi:MIP/aquaporin family protein [Taklimakanibacter deserti]|uniref:MIP/aquaporin family protein n=1 Tax=Taklimakanibacter deserti TaxID=2267839 RepID=UPI000E659B29
MLSANIGRYAAEFIGTAILVFFAAGAVMAASMVGGLPVPLIGGAASGLALMILIWCFVDISGGHFNPALTVVLAVFGDFPKSSVLGYLTAQLAGSVAGAALLYYALGPQAGMGANMPNTALAISGPGAFIIECFLSFAMMLTIRAAFATGEQLRQFAAVPIGLVVGIEVMVMGPIAGAAMNPARAFGPYVFLGDWHHYWIYALGPLLGILLGALAWDRLIAPKR